MFLIPLEKKNMFTFYIGSYDDYNKVHKLDGLKQQKFILLVL